MTPHPRLSPTPRWWADAAGVTAALSLAVVTVLWIAHHGGRDVTGGGSAAGVIGRLAALWSSDLLLIQVVLMARMLACGVGITPLLALLWDLPYGHGRATLVYRAGTPRRWRSSPSWTGWPSSAASAWCR
jgi:hypothetical protein